MVNIFLHVLFYKTLGNYLPKQNSWLLLGSLVVDLDDLALLCLVKLKP